MICNGPEWVYDLFFWMEYNLINKLELDKALNWLYEKGIVYCNYMV